MLLQPEFGVSRSTYPYYRAIINAAHGGNANVMRLFIEAADFSSSQEKWSGQLWVWALQ